MWVLKNKIKLKNGNWRQLLALKLQRWFLTENRVPTDHTRNLNQQNKIKKLFLRQKFAILVFAKSEFHVRYCVIAKSHSTKRKLRQMKYVYKKFQRIAFLNRIEIQLSTNVQPKIVCLTQISRVRQMNLKQYISILSCLSNILDINDNWKIWIRLVICHYHTFVVTCQRFYLSVYYELGHSFDHEIILYSSIQVLIFRVKLINYN